MNTPYLCKVCDKEIYAFAKIEIKIGIEHPVIMHSVCYELLLSDSPICVKYFNEVMPIIVSYCWRCGGELSKSMVYEITNPHKSFCQKCLGNIDILP